MATTIKGQGGVMVWNWAQTFHCCPREYFEPESVDQIKTVLTRARREGVNVKVIGEGHSPSDLPLSHGFVVNLKKYTGIKKIDDARKRVTVKSGTRLKDLHVLLRKSGYACSNLGSVSDLTIAGICQTHTHGTGSNFGIFATTVTEYTIIYADGTQETLNLKQMERSGEAFRFRAILGGIGAMGVLESITVQVEDDFWLTAKQCPKTFDEVLENVERDRFSAEHYRFWWIPHTNMCVEWKANRCGPPTKPLPKPGVIGRFMSWVRDTVVGYHLLEFVYYLSTSMPSLVPLINRLYWYLLFNSEKRQLGPSNEVFNFDCLFKQYVTEWAIPAVHCPQAMRDIKAMIRREKIRAHFPIEVRFVKGDKFPISPCYGRDTCYIGIIMYRPYGKDVEHSLYWAEFEKIMLGYRGRPHWAKKHPLTPNMLSDLYPDFEAFCALRRKLDPQGVFLNDYLRRSLFIDDIKTTVEISDKRKGHSMDPPTDADLRHATIEKAMEEQKTMDEAKWRQRMMRSSEDLTASSTSFG
eukprot:Clim_evm50s156 gene=Clim_evmTU50s156